MRLSETLWFSLWCNGFILEHPASVSIDSRLSGDSFIVEVS